MVGVTAVSGTVSVGGAAAGGVSTVRWLAGRRPGWGWWPGLGWGCWLPVVSRPCRWRSRDGWLPVVSRWCRWLAGRWRVVSPVRAARGWLRGRCWWFRRPYSWGQGRCWWFRVRPGSWPPGSYSRGWCSRGWCSRCWWVPGWVVWWWRVPGSAAWWWCCLLVVCPGGGWGAGVGCRPDRWVGLSPRWAGWFVGREPACSAAACSAAGGGWWGVCGWGWGTPVAGPGWAGCCCPSESWGRTWSVRGLCFCLGRRRRWFLLPRPR